MKNIFIGMLFALLDFNITVGTSKIGLLPDFVGYIIILKGMQELLEESSWFQKITSFTIGMAIYSAVIYVLDLLGITVGFGTLLSTILSIITIGITLYINYAIVMGVRDMEARHECELRSEPLYSAWKMLAILSALGCLLIFLPYLNIFTIIAMLVAQIYYIYCFSKSKNMYYSFFES